MLCVFGFGLVACDNRTEKEKNFVYPSKDAEIVGNGGLAVQKGNYVYFVNGYKSITSSGLKKKASHTVGSLMLMKLGDDGQVVTDDDGLLDDDYYITMSKKLCGYEVTNLFIHGNYLYFVTPCLENEAGKKGPWAKERVVFKRIKLDKTGEVEEIYQSGVKYDNLEFEYYENGNNLYILAWEKGNSYYAKKGTNALVRVNATKKSSKKIANNVSSVVFADNLSEIFFVEDDTANSTYELNKYDISKNDVDYYTTFEKSTKALFSVNGKVYVSQDHDYQVADETVSDLFVSDIESASAFEELYSYGSDTTLNITPDGNLVAISGNEILLIQSASNKISLIDEEATSIHVVGYTNGCIVYYDEVDSNSNIKIVSYYNLINNGTAEIETLTTISKVEKDFAYFDMAEDENYLYFLNKTGSNYYLNRLKVNNNLDQKEEMFGVYLEADEPEVEEDEEADEE